MKILNKNASEIAVKIGLKAATDITGFSLLGHANEMSKASKIKIVIEAKSFLFCSTARSYGQKGYFAGGASDNRIFFSSRS